MTQEPVAWMSPDESAVALTKLHESWVPLYTIPKKWAGLTEPVKMVAYNYCLCGTIMKFESENCIVAPQREWVGLTDEEIKEIVGPWGETPVTGYTRKLFDQIEAKLKEKNT